MIFRIFIPAMIFALLLGCNSEKPAEQPAQKKAPVAQNLKKDAGVTKVAEPAFEGFYVFGDEGNLFIECASGKTYWVTGDQDMLKYLRERYVSVAKKPLEEVYVQFRGEKLPGVKPGETREYEGMINVKSVIAFRKKQDTDCPDFKR